MEHVFVWTFRDVVGLFIVSIFILAMLISHFHNWRNQHRCKHEKFFETSRCDAICSKCNKNLGFIGTVREERKAK